MKTVADMVKMSDCGTCLVIDEDPSSRYQVEFEKGDFLVVVAGACVGKASICFEHPNVVAYNLTVHEFKHYRKNGSKFWTAKAGKDFYFVIPKSEIMISKEKGYSYVPAIINGVKVKFNVSGGTQNGWTDWVGNQVSISVNHSRRDLKKLAEVSVTDSGIIPTIRPLDQENQKRWERLAARNSHDLLNKIQEMKENAQTVRIKLNQGFNISQEGTLIDFSRRFKRTFIKREGNIKTFSGGYDGAIKRLVVCFGGSSRYSVKLNQIDWAATAACNGLTLKGLKA